MSSSKRIESTRTAPKIAKQPTPPPESKHSVEDSPGWSDNDDQFLDPEDGIGNEDDIDLDQLSLGEGGHED